MKDSQRSKNFNRIDDSFAKIKQATIKEKNLDEETIKKI